MIIFSFFVFISFSLQNYGPTFMGKWKRSNPAGVITDKAFMSISLFFYQMKNKNQKIPKKDENFLTPINTTFHNNTNIFNQDQTLGVLGKVRLDNSTYTNFGENNILCVGVYRKNTSDIILICPLRNLLLNTSKLNINQINNKSFNTESNHVISKMPSLFMKIEDIFKDFNYDDTISSITKKEFEDFKSNIQNKNFKYLLSIANRSIPLNKQNYTKSNFNSSKTDFNKTDKIYQVFEKQIIINTLQYYKQQVYSMSEFRSHFMVNYNTSSSLRNNNFIINRHLYFSLIYLQVSNASKIENPFDLNCMINGLFIPDYKNRIIPSIFTIKAQEINASLLNREARVFGAISGVFFAFLIFVYRITKFQDYHLTSTASALMNTSYDLGYGNILYLVGKIDESTTFLFSILSFGYGALFFINTFRIVFKSWSSVNEARFREIPPLAQRHYYTLFLFRCNAFYITSLLSFTNISNNSLFVMLLLFSNWIPQIFFNIINGCRNSIPKSYYIGVTYIRLFEMGYNFLCPTNMLFIKKDCRTSFFIAFCWSSFQVAFLFLQSKFGGAFFLPKSMKNNPYDYYARKPPTHTECPICLSEINPDTEVAVTTPCNHSFHEACLRRWMQEQSICPMCRRSLPPISEPEPIV